MSKSEGAGKSMLAQRYEIRREIGRGGMATVYLADDVRHDRQVAVKVLLPELSAAIGAERFSREIKLVARLQHPHILSLYARAGRGAPRHQAGEYSPCRRPRVPH